MEMQQLRKSFEFYRDYCEGEKNDGAYEGKILDRQLSRESPVLSTGGLRGCPILIKKSQASSTIRESGIS